jgi:hypothetical protein
VRSIKLMTDYGCFPVWEIDSAAPRNIDPQSLPISARLKADLEAWAASYDATLNLDDPAASGFHDADEEVAFRRTGVELGARLTAELGGEFVVQLGEQYPA